MSDQAGTSPFPEAPTQNASLFAPTRWSLVRRAVTQAGALGEWLGLYWYPLYVWARRRGASEADAADGVQGFLEKLCERSLLAQADENRGRLRSWLLTAFGNHLASLKERAARKKRGGQAEHVAIDWTAVEAAYQAHLGMAPQISPEAQYARAWALTLMEEALIAVETHYAGRGQAALFAELAPALDGPLVEESFAEVAARLGTNAVALRQSVQRLRQRYRRTLLEIASERLGIQGEARVSAEIRAMLAG